MAAWLVYYSAGGAEIKVSSYGTGAKFGYANTDAWQAVMNGMYMTAGGEVVSGAGVTIEETVTLPSEIAADKLHGAQITCEISGPVLGVHQHYGLGKAGIESELVWTELWDKMFNQSTSRTGAEAGE